MFHLALAVCAALTMLGCGNGEVKSSGLSDANRAALSQATDKASAQIREAEAIKQEAFKRWTPTNEWDEAKPLAQDAACSFLLPAANLKQEDHESSRLFEHFVLSPPLGQPMYPDLHTLMLTNAKLPWRAFGGARAAAANSVLERATSRLAGGALLPGEGLAKMIAEVAAAPQLLDWELTIVMVAPRDQAVVERGSSSFEAGRLRGRALLYNYATKQVVCAGDIDATNSDNVKVRGLDNPKFHLELDLAENAYRAAKTALRDVRGGNNGGGGAATAK